MGAMFGILGDATRDDLRAMGARLAHRGGDIAVEPVPGAGWLGVIAHDPKSRLSVAGGVGVACHASLYDHSDPATTFATASGQGPDAVQAIDADFALARLDGATGELTLARDPFGTFPVFTARLPAGGLAFASEQKALLALPGVTPRADRPMLQHLQHAKRLPVGRTLLEGIEEIPPGVVRTLDRAGSVIAEHTPAPIEGAGRVTDPDEACELIRAHMERAARARVGDLDPIGLALSGGIDSIALAFLFHHLFPGRRLVTLSAGSHADDHELVTARGVAAAVGSDHHEIITHPRELAADLPALAWHMEDPTSRSEAYQLFRLGRAARDAGLGVVFHGQGADGMFAGMPRSAILALVNKYPFARRDLEQFFSYTQFGLSPTRPLARLGVFAKFRGSLAPVPRVVGGEAPEPVRFPESGPQFINRVLAASYRRGVFQDLRKFERTFGAWGVEPRTINTDDAFVRAAFDIDDALKIKGGQQKWVFRRAVEPWVPAEFRDIPKFPQRMEANRDLADALDELFDDLLAPDAVRERGIFEPESIQRLRRSGRSKPYTHEGGMRLWTAVMTELWARAFLDRRGEEATRG
ncbi:MAG: asparagine synthase-related protein [Phycisphaerales bacterium]